MKAPFLIITFSFLIFDCSIIHGQSKLGSGGSDRIEGKSKFVPLPYVNYDRAFGFSVGAIPLMMFNPSTKDTISPSSLAGVIGSYSENETWFLIGFGKLYLKEDTWRVLYAGGVGDFNYQFFVGQPINQWIGYQTNLGFAFLEVKRKIVPDLYGGVNYLFTQFETSIQDPIDSAEITTLHGLGFAVDLDKRSNVSYPRSGFYTAVDLTTYPSAFGNENVSNQIDFEFNQYIPVRQNIDVFAARLYAGFGLGDVSFNQQIIVRDIDLRGYSQGQYRGNYLFALQGEYRWNLFKRFGAVGFAGVASVFGSNNEEDNGKLLPGIGCGIRYTFVEDTHSNIGVDIATGTGDWSLNFRFSEAF